MSSINTYDNEMWWMNYAGVAKNQAKKILQNSNLMMFQCTEINDRGVVFKLRELHSQKLFINKISVSIAFGLPGNDTQFPINGEIIPMIDNNHVLHGNEEPVPFTICENCLSSEICTCVCCVITKMVNKYRK